MKNPVQVRHPGLQVLLRKNIGRATAGEGVPVSERFAGQKRTIDLTPYFGDAGAVQVNKSVREPAGAFAITFSDKINPDAADTVYGLVEPMDVVEIRIAGDAYKAPSTSNSASGASGQVPLNFPIMMRGLVSEVRRTEAMGAGGKPQRAVSISGQDYGKIWQIMQVFYSPFVDPSANLVTSFPTFARFGLSMQPEYAEEFVQEVFDKVLNPYIAKMQAKTGGASSPLLPIATDGIAIQDGIVSPFGTGSWQGGSIYDLLASFCDVGPWNELYIEDRESGPRVVFRPNPFMAADGQSYILPVQQKPDIIEITRADVVSMTVARTDANIANYFWVQFPRFALNYDDPLRQMSFGLNQSNVYQSDYGNNDPDLYGIRRLQAQTQEGGRNESNSGNGTPAGSARDVNQSNALAWMNLRLQQLRDMNKDNVIFETGSITIKGNENVRAGTYLRLTHGNMRSDYYVVSASHNYVPFGGYTTTVQFERGKGFIDRVQKGSGPASPYWAELGDA